MVVYWNIVSTGIEVEREREADSQTALSCPSQYKKCGSSGRITLRIRDEGMRATLTRAGKDSRISRAINDYLVFHKGNENLGSTIRFGH